MDTEIIKTRIAEDFDLAGIAKRQAEQQTQAPSVMPAEPVDLYQQNYNKRFEQGKKSYPHGSSAIVNTAVISVVDGDGAEGLAHAYKRAKDDSDLLKGRGERDRAEMVRQQYMEEHFLPAVEIVVNSTSPDEVLNSKKALDELDKYALLEGSGRGYTASYVRQAYGDQLGQVEGRSDALVQSEMRKINGLLDDGQVRAAYGMANKLKKQIDRGEWLANDADYALLGRIVAYYEQ